MRIFHCDSGDGGRGPERPGSRGVLRPHRTAWSCSPRDAVIPLALIPAERTLPMDNRASSSALVLFSGGQDSATCLAWALSRFHRVETLSFDYGQRHVVELECRSRVLESLRAHFPKWAPKL